eukprot:m.781664 g.781664  ORF g.781664 m.781664 type:complete len:55 (-) comp59148_c0_seq13:37-201(-)
MACLQFRPAALRSANIASTEFAFVSRFQLPIVLVLLDSLRMTQSFLSALELPCD